MEASFRVEFLPENKIKIVPRGAGTGLSGGSLPLADCVLLAIGKFNKILELDPKHPEVLYNKGLCLARLGKYESALLYYNKALEIDHNPEILLYKGFPREGYDLPETIGKNI